MADPKIEPVYLPGNEPYLGNEILRMFDLTIPRALQVHARVGSATFGRQLSPLESAAAQIVPQGVSVALSIRELIRQAYLYSAAILLRPLVERTGMAQFLAIHSEAVAAWHQGWPRSSQPAFKVLVELVMPESSDSDNELTKDILHKLMHSDPKGAEFNMFTRHDGRRAFASGKELGQPKKAEAIGILACHCLRRLTATAVLIFGRESGEV